MTLTERQRFMLDRYRPMTNYSTSQLRTILVEDGVARRPTPLDWAILAYSTIARAERVTPDVVFEQVRGEVFSRCGLEMPMAG